MTGYSDRINHALAFAAKHHDHQVRRGVRLPYLTHPPNVAIILTRYGQSDDTVIAGILLNVVKDYVNEGHNPEVIAHRIGDKFGATVLETVLAAAPARVAEGREIPPNERRQQQLAQLARMSEGTRWVIAADALHEAATLLADLNRTIDRDAVWLRRNGARSIAWYHELIHGLHRAEFGGTIVDELAEVVASLEASR